MGEKERGLGPQKLQSLEVARDQSITLHVLPLCVIVALWLGAVKWAPHLDTSVLFAVYPPEIVSVNPTSELDMYKMTIDSFHTTFGPLRYEIKWLEGIMVLG